MVSGMGLLIPTYLPTYLPNANLRFLTLFRLLLLLGDIFLPPESLASRCASRAFSPSISSPSPLRCEPTNWLAHWRTCFSFCVLYVSFSTFRDKKGHRKRVKYFTFSKMSLFGIRWKRTKMGQIQKSKVFYFFFGESVPSGIR